MIPAPLMFICAPASFCEGKRIFTFLPSGIPGNRPFPESPQPVPSSFCSQSPAHATMTSGHYEASLPPSLLSTCRVFSSTSQVTTATLNSVVKQTLTVSSTLVRQLLLHLVVSNSPIVRNTPVQVGVRGRDSCLEPDFNKPKNTESKYDLILSTIQAITSLGVGKS